MTEIEVPDWVVEVAASARLRSLLTSTHHVTEREAMRAALQAALAEMLEPVGYFDPDVIEHFNDSKIDPVGVLRRSPNGVSRIQIFRIRGPQ